MTTLSDTLTFLGRTALALVAVVTLIWWLAKRATKAGGTPTGPSMKVVARASTGRHTSVQVVAVGTRRLLVGVSDQTINLLTELAPGVDLAAAAPAVPVAPVTDTADKDGALFSAHLNVAKSAVTGATAPGVLAGSILSPATWKATWATLKGRSGR